MTMPALFSVDPFFSNYKVIKFHIVIFASEYSLTYYFRINLKPFFSCFFFLNIIRNSILHVCMNSIDLGDVNAFWFY
jgi:hypothetical protein